MRSPEFVYKVVSRDVFDACKTAGSFVGMPVDLKDGYVHFSTATQLSETLRLHFAGRPDLLVLAVRTADLGARLRWEPSRGGQLFPHLYGELAMSLIVGQAPVPVALDGNAVLPEWVR